MNSRDSILWNQRELWRLRVGFGSLLRDKALLQSMKQRGMGHEFRQVGNNKRIAVDRDYFRSLGYLPKR
jgi:hypothetical protein